jgi:cysteinyl-tRNA synthetase
MWEWIRAANRHDGDVGDSDLREMLGVLALEGLFAAPAEAPAEVVALATARRRAREARDFARADELRVRIEALGWSVRDTATGFELTPLQ